MPTSVDRPPGGQDSDRTAYGVILTDVEMETVLTPCLSSRIARVAGRVPNQPNFPLATG